MTPRPLWFVGDVHLGRAAVTLPRALADHDVDALRLAPAAAFLRLIDAVLESEAEALVFAGDLVDSENARFEAYGLLERGVRRLVDAGVRVFAVAGNHDVVALPRLAREVRGFELLGQGGHWEERALEHASLVGWSFPEARVKTSPLGALRLEPSARPRFGVLHCDLDASSSHHAPVARAELLAQPVDAWMLGHIHAPSFAADAGGMALGYLGSLSPLHRGEVGPRSALRVDFADRGWSFERVELAPLRFEEVRIVLDDTMTDDIATVVLAAMRDRLAALQATSVEVLVLRIRVGGRVRDAARLRAELRALDIEAASVTLGSKLACACELRCDLRTALDVEALARGGDAVAVLAREVLELEAAVEAERATALAMELQDFDARLRLETRFRAVQARACEESPAQRLLRVGHAMLASMLSSTPVSTSGPSNDGTHAAAIEAGP